MIAGAGERGVDIRDAHLELMRHAAGAGGDLVPLSLGHDDGAVVADAELGAMAVSDLDPLTEAERRLEPCHGGSNVGIDEHRRHRRRRRGAVGQHV